MRPLISAGACMLMFAVPISISFAADDLIPSKWAKNIDVIVLDCSVNTIDHSVYPRRDWEVFEQRPIDLAYNLGLCTQLADHLKRKWLSGPLSTKTKLAVTIGDDTYDSDFQLRNIGAEVLRARADTQWAKDRVAQLEAYEIAFETLPMLIDPPVSPEWQEYKASECGEGERRKFGTKWLNLLVLGQMDPRPQENVGSWYNKDDGTDHSIFAKTCDLDREKPFNHWVKGLATRASSCAAVPASSEDVVAIFADCIDSLLQRMEG